MTAVSNVGVQVCEQRGCPAQRRGGEPREDGAAAVPLRGTLLNCTVLYCTVLYCTALLGAAHSPRQPPAVPLRGDEAQVCRLSHRRAHRGQVWLAKILEVSYDLCVGVRISCLLTMS